MTFGGDGSTFAIVLSIGVLFVFFFGTRPEFLGGLADNGFAREVFTGLDVLTATLGLSRRGVGTVLRFFLTAASTI